jgi:endonuclease/exonuclease/phosphatase family metal-dependent hydrolase
MKLCLVSCNIRFDNPADGDNAWMHRRDFLVQTLLKHSPVLIATQEGRFHQLNELRTSLGDYQLIDQHRSWIGERMYPSFFIQDESFEYIGSGDMWLSETPDIAGSLSFESAFPRLMTWTKLQVKETKKNLLVINTHLDHVKQQTRLGQVNVLIQEIKRIWDKQAALIIMGDFNDGPDSEVRKLIESEFSFLKDAWKMFNQVEESSHHAFKGEIENGTRIDWILVDQNFTIESCHMDKTHQEGKYPSDHYPIVCEIKI